MKKEETIKIINEYLNLFPNEKKDLKVLIEQLEEKDFFDRKNFKGHVVANALIIKEGEVLTIFHNKLKMFLQPGGHVDPEDNSVLEATLREVKEETGLEDLKLWEWHKENNNIPIFIESHLIPLNLKKGEDEHYHHDFMYVFYTDVEDITLQLEEVSEFEWVKIEKVLKENPDSFISKSLEKMNKEKV